MNLVVGASGVLGSRVVARLLERGERVRAVTRDPARLSGPGWSDVETVRGDMLERDWMPAALEGVRHVVIAAHGLVPPSRRNTPAVVDGDGARALIDAAASGAVRRVVYMSVAGAEREANAFARVKRATERHLMASGVPWTVLRPSAFPENHALLLMGEPLRAGKPVPFFGKGTEAINWVSADDVAEDVVRVLADESTVGTVREVRGPDRMSRRDALELLERHLGVSAKRQHLPLPLVKVVHAGARLFHPGVAYLVGMALDEIARGGDPEVEDATWRGTTRVEDVIARWADGAVATADPESARQG